MVLQPGRELGGGREKKDPETVSECSPQEPRGRGVMHSLIDSGDGQGKKKTTKKTTLRHVLGAEMPVSRPHFPESYYFNL